MEFKIIKVSNSELKTKSYQMRIQFKSAFANSDFEIPLIDDFDKEWQQIGVYYSWHIGENFADGFFDDFNNLKISLETIAEASTFLLNKYNEKIVSVIFKEIN